MCFAETPFDEYIAQLDNPEPHGAAITIHLVACAFNTTINLFVEKMNGAVLMFRVFSELTEVTLQLPPYVKRLEPNQVNILKKEGVYYPVKQPNQKLIRREHLPGGNKQPCSMMGERNWMYQPALHLA